MMPSLPTKQFADACGIFLRLAYPDGHVPANRLPFLGIPPDGLEAMLTPPICEQLIHSDGRANELRGYAFRLGSSDFPHVKLQIHWQERPGTWIFAVDTHDAIHVPQDNPDYPRFQEIRLKNRLLKERIEQAWEAQGLLTFNASLRQELDAQKGREA